jgi:hypothetical protein
MGASTAIMYVPGQAGEGMANELTVPALIKN